jgi:hypothetical protein
LAFLAFVDISRRWGAPGTEAEAFEKLTQAQEGIGVVRTKTSVPFRFEGPMHGMVGEHTLDTTTAVL